MMFLWGAIAGAILVYLAFHAGLSHSEKHSAWLVQELRTQAEKAQRFDSLHATLQKQTEAMLLYEKKLVSMNETLTKLFLVSYNKPVTRANRDLQVGEEATETERVTGMRAGFDPAITALPGEEGFVEAPASRKDLVFSQPT